MRPLGGNEVEKEVIKGGPPDGIRAPLRRDNGELALCPPWGDAKRGCKPGREPTLEPHHAGTLISDFQPSELGESKFLFFKTPSLR